MASKSREPEREVWITCASSYLIFHSCNVLISTAFLIFFNQRKLQEPKDKSKEKEKGRLRNIDNFMEELKHEQEMREKRNQERERWRDGRHDEHPAVSFSFFIIF